MPSLTPVAPEDTLDNSSFSKVVPGLQIAIDSTSLGTFKECPRKYYYSNVLGYQGRRESVHLRFGIHLHEAAERYHQRRALGDSHDDALDAALDRVLKDTWNRELDRPWVSDHPAKTRPSLIRSVVWYLDRYADAEGTPTVTLENGKAAVELSFRFDSGIITDTGESIAFCGHLDRIIDIGGRLFVSDIKTTGSQLGPSWFDSFTPGNQFSMYTLAGQVAFGTPVEGVIVDGVQVGVGFTRFARGPVNRPRAVMEEWLSGTQHWLQAMEESALEERWIMNDKSCGNYGGCPFQKVCSIPPAQRHTALKMDFVKRVWDPLKVRGDV